MTIARTTVTKTVTSVTSGTSGRARFNHASGRLVPVGALVTNSGFGVSAYNVAQGVTASAATWYELTVAYSSTSAGSGTYDYIAVVGSKVTGTATSATSTTLSDSGMSWTTNQFAGRYFVTITGGPGAGQIRDIVSNTATALAINRAWTVTPDATSTYAISWNWEDVKAASDAGSWGAVTKTGSHYLVDLPVVVGDGSTYSPFGDANVSFEMTKAQGEFSVWSATSVAMLHGRDAAWLRFGQIVDEAARVTANGVVYRSTSSLTLPELLSVASSADLEFLGSTHVSNVTGFFWHLAGADGRTFRAWNSSFLGVDTLQGAVGAAGATYSIADFYRVTIDKQSLANGIGLRAAGSSDDIQITSATLAAVSPVGWQQTIRYRGIKALACTNAVRCSTNTITGQCVTECVDWKTTTWQMRFDGNAKIVGTDIVRRMWSVNLSSVNGTDGLQVAMFDATGAEVFNAAMSSGVLSEKIVLDSSWANKTATSGEVQIEADRDDRNPHRLVIRKHGRVPQLRTGIQITTPIVEAINDLSNSYVVASEATAAVMTDIAIDGAAQTITLSSARTLQDVYDRGQWWSAQSASMAYDVPLSTADGINVTLASGWSLSGIGHLTSGGQRLSGAVVISAPGAYSPVLGTATITITAAGTYDLRGADLSGTITLVNTSGGPVLVKVATGVTVTNLGPDLTVEVSRVMSISAANVPAGASVRLVNVTSGAELDIEIGLASAGYTTAVTVTAGGDVETGDTLRLDAIRAAGTSYSRYYTAQAVVGASGDWTVIEPWETWTEASALGVDGSAVTDFRTDYTSIQIDIQDTSAPGFWVKELVGFLLYKTAAEADGLRNFFGALLAQNAARWVVDVAAVDLTIDNLSASSVQQTDEVIISRSDGATLAVQPTTGGGGIGFAIANDVAALLPSGSAVAASVRTELATELARIDTSVSSRLAGAAYTAPGTPAETAAAVLAAAIETGMSLKQAMQIVSAATAGKVSGGGTNVVKFRSAVADDRDAITATVDENGNRIGVSVNV